MGKPYLRKYYQEHKEELKNRSMESFKELKEEINRKIPHTCKICGRSYKRIVKHEIYGKLHPYGGTRGLKYILEHLEDFIPTCSFCHDTIHRLAKYPELLEYTILIIMENRK